MTWMPTNDSWRTPPMFPVMTPPINPADPAPMLNQGGFMGRFQQAYNNPLFHIGLGILSTNNVGKGGLLGLESYQAMQANAARQAYQREQAELYRMKLEAEEEERKRKLEEQERLRREQERLGQLLPENMRGLPYSIQEKVALQSLAPPERTNIENMLVAAGLQPGTAEFQKAVLQYALKPQSVIQNLPSPPAGYYFKDPASPQEGLVAIEGGPAEKPTEGQVMAGGYADRMFDAARQINELESKGFSPSDPMESARAGISNYLATPEFQTYRAAQEDWVRAKLRKESGAVIGEEEMAREITTYFPQLGDSKQVIERKARQRQTAERAMAKAAGAQYSRMIQQLPQGFDEIKQIGGKSYGKRNGQWYEVDQ